MMSQERVLTSHAGSLPRPEDLVARNRRRSEGDRSDEDGYQDALKAAVVDLVGRQKAIGIDLVNDGEYGHSMGHRYDYGSWWTYVFQRLGGLEIAEIGMFDLPQAAPKGDGIRLASFNERRDWLAFSDAYDDPSSGAALPDTGQRQFAPICRGPITYQGHDAVQRDIANFKAALDAAGLEDGYLNSVAPGSCGRFGNEHYANDEEVIYACADAMREEYQAILDAGLLLQIDFPGLISSWDARTTATLAEYRAWAEGRIEHLNHALRGLPEDRIRFHTCYGVNFGPRVSDLQLADIIDLFFTIKAGAYSFEAANPRHEHEWRVPQKVKLPDGKMLIPGVVTHSNVMIEHPEVVADRIERWAGAVGRENVMVGNDCGFQSTAGNTEIPITVAWAKLQALGDGARIASDRLWR
jgi:5-methyltetrahydropteroyltriglutamate--homocysteine methyltransferase